MLRLDDAAGRDNGHGLPTMHGGDAACCVSSWTLGQRTPHVTMKIPIRIEHHQTHPRPLFTLRLVRT